MEPDPINLGVGILPEIVLREILKKTDKQDILNARLVCVKWNETVQDTSQLMKYLKFPILDAASFLNLQIAKKRKVRSIILKKSNLFESSSSDCKQRFMDSISYTIENVEFAFIDSNIQQQSELVKLILENCYNLKEITIQNSKIRMMKNEWRRIRGLFETTKGLLLQTITPETVIASANKINFISIEGISAPDIPAIVIVILQLPKLQQIQFSRAKTINEYEFCKEIITALVQYIQKYQRALHLKELTLCEDFSPTSVECTQSWILLITLCEKHGILINKPPTFNFNRLFELEESPSFQLQHLPLFPTKVDGEITIEGPLLTNLYRVGSLNVGVLRICFDRDTLPGELRWLGNLGNLDTLTFETEFFVTLGLPTTEELNQALSVGLSTVKKLGFRNSDLHNSIQQFRWNQYFPNLKELLISNSRITPNDFIAKLTELESLSCLTLQSSSNLNDMAFTLVSENRFEAHNGSSELAPAIACFKSLKKLGISWCPLLTDECVINGISKCKTLESLAIHGCKKITSNCTNLVDCEVEYYY